MPLLPTGWVSTLCNSLGAATSGSGMTALASVLATFLGGTVTRRANSFLIYG